MKSKNVATKRIRIAAVVATTLFLGCGGSVDDPESMPIVVPTQPTGPQIAVAKDRTCVVTRDGRVQCWGGNENQKLGASCRDTCEGREGKTSCCLAPVEIPNLVEVAQIALGAEHSCALVRNGSVVCWGANAYGQIGNGSLQAAAVPQVVHGLFDVRQIVAGDAHTCALLGDSSVQCWGSNNSGQLGDGTMKDRATPTPIPHLRGVTQLAATWRVSCALLGDGRGQCWVYRLAFCSAGRLGLGSGKVVAAPAPASVA